MKIEEFMEACELKRDNQQWVDLYKVAEEAECTVGHWSDYNPDAIQSYRSQRGKGSVAPNCEVRKLATMDPEPIPEWEDLLLEIAKAERALDGLKRQIMRYADKIKGKGVERCEE